MSADGSGMLGTVSLSPIEPRPRHCRELRLLGMHPRTQKWEEGPASAIAQGAHLRRNGTVRDLRACLRGLYLVECVGPPQNFSGFSEALLLVTRFVRRLALVSIFAAVSFDGGLAQSGTLSASKGPRAQAPSSPAPPALARPPATTPVGRPRIHRAPRRPRPAAAQKVAN